MLARYVRVAARVLLSCAFILLVLLLRNVELGRTRGRVLLMCVLMRFYGRAGGSCVNFDLVRTRIFLICVL